MVTDSSQHSAGGSLFVCFYLRMGTKPDVFLFLLLGLSHRMAMSKRTTPNHTAKPHGGRLLLLPKPLAPNAESITVSPAPAGCSQWPGAVCRVGGIARP